jgi:hypothetical protein
MNENDASLLISKSRGKALGHKWTDLLWWEVDDAYNLFSYELIGDIVICDLCRRAFDAYIVSKIYSEFVCRFFGFRKWLDVNHCAYT